MVVAEGIVVAAEGIAVVVEDTAVVEAAARSTPVAPAAAHRIWAARTRLLRGSVPRIRDLRPRDPHIRVPPSAPVRRRDLPLRLRRRGLAGG